MEQAGVGHGMAGIEHQETGQHDQESAWHELDAITRQLTEVSARAARQMRVPNVADPATRLLAMVAELLVLVADGHRASAEAKARGLRELVRTKNDFVHMTTHELRRPLGLIKGYVSLLEEGSYGELPERTHDAIRRVARAAQEMAVLVDGLAGVARLEDGADALRIAPYRLSQIVTEAVAAVEEERAATHIRVEPRISLPDPEIDVDADRLRIAVVNLLSNALKYGPESSTVTIATQQEGREATITVTDQGHGVELPDPFGKWSRGASCAPGLGLGLYIVRKIAELHGGRVTLKSTPGDGSTFGIVLPRGERFNAQEVQPEAFGSRSSVAAGRWPPDQHPHR